MIQLFSTGITLVIGILIAKFLSNLQGMPNPLLQGFGPEDRETPITGVPSFEIATINHFLEAAMSGRMPGGEITTLPLFPKEYMHQLSNKYADWASEPHKSLPAPPMEGPLGEMLGHGPGESPAPIIRVMLVLSGMDNIFAFALNQNKLEPSLKSIKTKLWFGIAPISDARWLAKGLDNETNIEEAMAIIQQVVDIFKYQIKSEVQGETRTKHNKIWTEFDVFNDAIIALRSGLGESPPEFDIARLWQEYIKILFKYQETQARAWAFQHLNVLFTVWKDRLLRVLQSGTQISETQTTIRVDHFAIMILNKLLDLYADAEIFLRTKTEGFAMPEGIDRRLIGSITLEKSPSQLNAIYQEMENQRQMILRGLLSTALQQRTTTRRSSAQQFPEFLESSSLVIDREFSQKELMAEMTTPKPLKIEPWIQAMNNERINQFGFVIYRNTYSETDEEWSTFITRLQEGLDSSWQGLVDHQLAKSKATLHWIDGKQENIPEDDVEAVRKHFKDFSESSFFPSSLTKTTCLAINQGSFKSFAQPNSQNQTGDFRGFVQAIEAGFDASKAKQPTNAPAEYQGHFNIIDQLVWTDLFASEVSGHLQKAEDYFLLAKPHPWGVYVGPTNGIQRRNWRQMKSGLERLAVVALKSQGIE